MTRTGSDMRSARLDLAGTREFTLPGAGEARRAAISEATRSWLTDLPLDAVRRGSAEGVDLLCGWNAEEMKLFALLDPRIGEVDLAGRCHRTKGHGAELGGSR